MVRYCGTVTLTLTNAQPIPLPPPPPPPIKPDVYLRLKFLQERKKLFSETQLVFYYQYCGLIGWATTRLYVMAH